MVGNWKSQVNVTVAKDKNNSPIANAAVVNNEQCQKQI